MANIKNKRILITGGTGFIGAQLIQLLSKNNELFCIGKKKVGSKIERNAIYIKHDLSDPLNNCNPPDDIDIIIHLAASLGKSASEDKIKTYKVNTLSTLELLEYAKEASVDLFLYASTGGVYGYGKQPFKESDPPSPIDFYTLTKYESELLVNSYNESFITIILRYFFPYGPGQKGRLIPNLVESIMQGRSILINDRGGPMINPIYITDVVQLTINTLTLKRSDIFNIGGLEKYTIAEISDLIGEYISKKIIYKRIDEMPSGSLIGDVTKIINNFNFKFVPFSEGLTSTIEYINNREFSNEVVY